MIVMKTEQEPQSTPITQEGGVPDKQEKQPTFTSNLGSIPHAWANGWEGSALLDTPNPTEMK